MRKQTTIVVIGTLRVKIHLTDILGLPIVNLIYRPVCLTFFILDTGRQALWQNVCSADPDEMSHFVAFHQGLYCLQSYKFLGQKFIIM